MGGATPGQNAIANQTSQFSQTLTQQASTVFGNSSSVFSDLVNSFEPIVAAGPSQNGFSAAEKSNLDSQAITQTGQDYRNAKAAAGDMASSVGGGNDSAVTGGSVTGANLNIADSAAAQTSDELGQINLADEQQGNANYNNAAKGLTDATSVFNPSTSAANSATNSQNAASSAANNVAAANNSWMGLVSAGLGGVTGALTGGLMGGFGGGSSPANLGSGDQGQTAVDTKASSSNALL